jgi:hypothetical protein
MDMTKAERRERLRKELREILHDGKGRLGHTFNFVLIALIVLSVAILVIHLLPSSPAYNTFMNVLEAIIVAFFTVEYCIRVYAAERRLRYVFSFYGLVDLISILPFYTGIFHTEYIRLLRLIRFFKLAEIEAAAGAEKDKELAQDIRLTPGEHVEYVVTKHPLFLIINCIPATVALGFGLCILLITNGNEVGITFGVILILFALVMLWKTWLDFSYDAIYLTNERLVFHNQHFLGRSINQTNYRSITNVKPSYPHILSFIFRYGSLRIETAADHPGEVQIDMVRDHERAAQRIMQKVVTSGYSMPG